MSGTSLKLIDPVICSMDASDVARIQSLKERLRGIPPPPYITNPRLTVTDVLPCLKEHFGVCTETYCDADYSVRNSDASNGAPCQFDVYLNNSLSCETLDELYEKLRKRCVTHETCSFLGTAPAPVLPPSSPLLDNDIVDLFPRSLSSPASPAPDLLSIEYAQRRSLSSSKQKRSLPLPPPKRPKLPINHRTYRLAAGLHDQKIIDVSKRSIPLLAPQLRPQPRLIEIPVKEVPKVVVTEAPKQQTVGSSLSVTHRKKLLWATSQAIKTQAPSIASNPLSLKQHVSALFSLCQTQWLVVQHESQEGGTSDRMLALATKLVPHVLERAEPLKIA